MSDPNACFGDVMVVGGGISGIQASLDLATSGYKVFLVEKAPTIGGKMAQLDKTFPTNDCSMCIESPKFIECDRHPNIEILTYTEVDRVEGEVGNFQVTLNRKARYVMRICAPAAASASSTARSRSPTPSTRSCRRARPSTCSSRRRSRWSPTSMSAAPTSKTRPARSASAPVRTTPSI